MRTVRIAWEQTHFGVLTLLLLVLFAAVGPLTPALDARAHAQIDVMAYEQQYSLSCEFASLYIVTNYWGAPIFEDHALGDTSWNDNPHYGFRGDISGAWGSTRDYGVYAEPLAEIARSHGFGADVSYGADADLLISYLDQGIATIVWVSARYEAGWYEYDASGEPYKIVPFGHVFVVNGYDDEGVHISDPGPGTLGHLTWDYFLSTWAIMDGMMLAVYPR